MMRLRSLLLISMMVMLMSAGSFAVDVVTYDNANHVISRRAADGSLVWQQDHTHDAFNLETGLDGDVYLGGFTDNRVYRFDAETGTRDAIAVDSSGIDRVSDIAFNNNGDLYVSTAATQTIRVWSKSSGYSSVTDFVTSGITSNASSLDFGSDIYGNDGVAELFVLDGTGNNSSNMMRVYNGATGVLENSWSLENTRRPGDVEYSNLDGRIYVSSGGTSQIHSFMLDGTDEKRTNSGTTNEGINYPRQIHDGLDGKWYVANRFAGTQSTDPAVTVYNSDLTAFDSVFVESANADWTGVTTIPEPATIAMLGLGSLIFTMRKKK